MSRHPGGDQSGAEHAATQRRRQRPPQTRIPPRKGQASVAVALGSDMDRSIRTIPRLALIGVLVLASASDVRAQSPPLWDKLSPGPHAVGFKSTWQLDYSR